MEGFVIKEDGTPVYIITGKQDGREIRIEESPEKRGWSKKVQFETVILADTFKNDKGILKAVKALFHTVLEVDVDTLVDQNECVRCRRNAKFHYLRAMKTGIFTVCWKKACRGVTSSGPIALFRDDDRTEPLPWTKIISQTPITKEQARMILWHLNRTATPDVSEFLKD